ncbi:MAG TPA: hypothetical protein PK263_00055 [bacterium]|nr:hypothetical protein [bacterium]
MISENEGELPILSQLHHSPIISDQRIAGGFISDATGKQMGVRERVFDSPQGEQRYVYKEVFNLKEARATMQIYYLLKQAGLPVVAFAKIIRTYNESRYRHFKNELVIAMEDLAQNGEFELRELSGDPKVEVPFRLKENLIRALAIIHNNDVCEFHPSLSLALRIKDDHSGKREVVDFKVIDYANFKTKNEFPDGKFELDSTKKLHQLLQSIGSSDSEKSVLQEFYYRVLESGEMHY